MLGTSRFVIRHLRTIGALLFVFLYSASISLATPPTTKYSPGDTLDPLCTPGSTNCSVQILPTQTGNTNKLLTTSGSVTSWTDTLTGVTLSGATNTLSNIGNASLTNSTISINGTPVALGGSVTNLALTTNPLSQFAATTSSQLAGVITDETGTGTVVYSTSPTLATPTFTGDSTTGTINGQTISSAANFTGSMSVAGNVGVGTVASAAMLEVAQSSGSNYFRISRTGLNTYGFSSTNNGTLNGLNIIDVTNNASRMFIDNSGNVGIGTTTPGVKLDVYGGNLRVDQTYDVTIGQNLLGQTGAGIAANNTLFIGTEAANSLVLNTNSTNRVVVGTAGDLTVNSGQLFVQQSTGRVGVGTTSPAYSLHVVGSSTNIVGDRYSDDSVASVFRSRKARGASSSPTPVLSGDSMMMLDAMGYDGTSFVRGASILFNANGDFTTLNRGTDIVFNTVANGATSNYERMRILSSGNVGIGTDSPSQRLVVARSGASNYFMVSGDNNASYDIATVYTNGPDSVYAGMMRGSGGATGSYNVHTGGAIRTSISSTGTLRLHSYGAGTLTTDASGNITASSDERLKDISGAYTAGLTEILALNPILYHWNTTSGYDTANEYAGFSAQDVQAALPLAVSTDPRGYLTLSDRPILAATVNAIKELDIKVQAIPSFEDVSLYAKIEIFLRGIAEQGIAMVDMVTTKKVQTDELCVKKSDGSNICLSGDQIQSIVDTQGLVIPPETPLVPPAPDPVPADPTCSDGIQNQDETGIDEGGVCGSTGDTPPPTDTPAPDPIPDTPQEPDPISTP